MGIGKPHWRMLFVLAVAWLACLPAAGEGKSHRAEILWDAYGVPHIFADTDAGIAYGFGWAQLRSHGDLILGLYAQARGRAAEYFGEEYLESDRTAWTHDVPALAASHWAAQSPRIQAIVEAFAAGMNAYGQAHGDTLAADLHVVFPVQPEDVFAHALRAIQLYFTGRVHSVESAAARWIEQGGSNGWAIGPRRTANGHALLLCNPHLAWSGMQTFYEAHHVTPTNNFYGTTLVGYPILSTGFNDYLGWTHTVNTIDAADTYELRLADGGYLFDGAVLPFEVREHTLKVLQEDGSHREEALTVRRSVHGPIVAMREDAAWAFRVAGMELHGAAEQTLDMTQARSLEEYESALGRLQLSMFNAIYADRDGNILLVFNGTVPKRSHGDWTYWQGRVPGDTSRTLWTEYHAYGELPRVVNPESGWLQNANEPPWYMTIPYPLDPGDFPPYMAPPSPNEAGVFRPLRSLTMLHENEGLTLERLVALKHDAKSGLAPRVMEDLVAAAMDSGEAPLAAAAVVLGEWDQHYLPESRGGVLFASWYQHYLAAVTRARSQPFAEGWRNDAAPLSVPAGIADAALALEALSAAVGTLEGAGVPLDVPWGVAMRMRVGEHEYPGAGGSSADTFRVVNYGRQEGGRHYATSGDTFVCAVEFSSPVRAKVITTYGNASQPGSPHRGDQLGLYARGEMRAALRTREEVEAHLSLHEVLGED